MPMLDFIDWFIKTALIALVDFPYAALRVAEFFWYVSAFFALSRPPLH
jgi:hypothetical protein